ncbi:MAG: transketolase [Clostridia bacterium]|nr:transketolase [Clostridia bacterium]
MQSKKEFCLCDKADDIRKILVEMIGRLGTGHIGGALSIVDVLTVLYFGEMNIDPGNPQKPDRDRLVVSKGHAGPALYATLAEKGFFPMEEIKTLNQPGTNLPSHCDMNKTPGIDMTAGSLGQGLSAAVGMALASKLDKIDNYIYAIIGDGESQEGQIYEALMYAGNKQLNNLIIFQDNNKMQIDGMTAEINSVEPFDKKGEAFNLFTQRVNGHNHDAIKQAIKRAKNQKKQASLIILDTIKGKGFDVAEAKGVGCHNMSYDEQAWRSYCNKWEA